VLELNRTPKRLICADDGLLGGNLNTIMKNTEAVLAVKKEVVLEVNAENVNKIIFTIFKKYLEMSKSSSIKQRLKEIKIALRKELREV
jgi:hypothetical protein